MTNVRAIDHSPEKANVWVDELTHELGTDDRNPSRTPATYHSAKEFLDRVAAAGAMHGDTEASMATAAASRVLREHVSAGEIEDVLAVLPAEIRALLEEA